MNSQEDELVGVDNVNGEQDDQQQQEEVLDRYRMPEAVLLVEQTLSIRLERLEQERLARYGGILPQHLSGGLLSIQEATGTPVANPATAAAAVTTTSPSSHTRTTPTVVHVDDSDIIHDSTHHTSSSHRTNTVITPTSAHNAISTTHIPITSIELATIHNSPENGDMINNNINDTSFRTTSHLSNTSRSFYPESIQIQGVTNVNDNGGGLPTTMPRGRNNANDDGSDWKYSKRFLIVMGGLCSLLLTSIIMVVVVLLTLRKGGVGSLSSSNNIQFPPLSLEYLISQTPYRNVSSVLENVDSSPMKAWDILTEHFQTQIETLSGKDANVRQSLIEYYALAVLFYDTGGTKTWNRDRDTWLDVSFGISPCDWNTQSVACDYDDDADNNNNEDINSRRVSKINLSKSDCSCCIVLNGIFFFLPLVISSSL